MHPIIYDVAVSLDGFICGPDGDVSKFAHHGPAVDDYLNRMASYTTVLMGRDTYEFGYAHGLEPGDNPYPHLEAFVFSRSLTLPEASEVTVVSDTSKDFFDDLRLNAGRTIYLCGGGHFAGWMLQNGLIDRVILKRAPVLYGSGTPLFGGVSPENPLKRISTKLYENGYLLEEFEVTH